MQPTSCLIVTVIGLLFLLCIYCLAWCWAIRAEEKRVQRKVYYEYFHTPKRPKSDPTGAYFTSLPDPTPEPEYHDDEPIWHDILLYVIMGLLIAVCAYFSK
jgi:hypothetical protein